MQVKQLPAQLLAWLSHRGGASQEPAAWSAGCPCTARSHWCPMRRAQTSLQRGPVPACCSTCSSPLPRPCRANQFTTFRWDLSHSPCVLETGSTVTQQLQHIACSMWCRGLLLRQLPMGVFGEGSHCMWHQLPVEHNSAQCLHVTRVLT